MAHKKPRRSDALTEQTTSSEPATPASELQPATPSNVIPERGSPLRNEGPGIGIAVAAGIAVAVLEPELLAGILLGAGAMMIPKVFPAVGRSLRAAGDAAMRATSSVGQSVCESFAEVGEQFRDIVAEVRAEHEQAQTGDHSEPAPELQKA